MDAALLRLHLARIRWLLMDVSAGWVMVRHKFYIDGLVGSDLTCESTDSPYLRCRRLEHHLQLGVQIGVFFRPWLSAALGYQFQTDGWNEIVSPTVLHRFFGRLSAHY